MLVGPEVEVDPQDDPEHPGWANREEFVSDIPLYICPDGHRWEDHSGVEAPLVNIKCSHCGKTAVRHHRARAVNRWKPLRAPLRTLTLNTRDFGSPETDPV